jgi:hypothetical protein
VSDIWLALLIGAALAPTDAALGAAVMVNRAVPARIRRLINVDRAHRFVGWLDGDYKPSEHFNRPRYRYPEHRAKS